ncbi:efflux RND transporter periplasmic adaptor subunit [Thermosulfuriphilus sp.]
MEKKKILHLVLALVILGLGVVLSKLIISSRPKLERASKAPYIPAVEVIPAVSRTLEVEITGYGTVVPVRTGKITSQVAGKVIYIAPVLVAGGRFKAGEVLLRLDPRDYQTALALAEADLKEAEKVFSEISAEAQISEKEWAEIGRDQGPAPDLVARKPQLAAAKAKLVAARARIQQARLDLARTEIRAPFDGLVLKAQVDLGQYVRPGEILAEIYASQEVEIGVSLSLEELRWIKVPGLNVPFGQGSKATVFVKPFAEKVSWPAEVVRVAAQADEKTRLLTVFVRVKGPFDRRPPLLPGLFAEVRFKGRSLKGAFILPRRALHYAEDGDWMVYVVDDKGILHLREVEVARIEPERVVITKGLASGEKVVVSRLSGAVEGMRVRILP